MGAESSKRAHRDVLWSEHCNGVYGWVQKAARVYPVMYCNGHCNGVCVWIQKAAKVYPVMYCSGHCNGVSVWVQKAARSYTVGDCDAVGTVIGNVLPKATDDDSSYQQNNVITYSGTGAVSISFIIPFRISRGSENGFGTSDDTRNKRGRNNDANSHCPGSGSNGV